MFSETLESVLTTQLDADLRAEWRARAAEAFGSWNERRLPVVETQLDDDAALRTIGYVQSIMLGMTRHAPILPGYGPTHLERAMTWALGLASDDELSRNDAIRLFLAAACDDIGRALVPTDLIDLTHTEASVVMFTELMDDIELPDEILIPVRYAIAAHSDADLDVDLDSYRVVDDDRTVDKLEALGGTGFVRALAHHALDRSLPMIPEGGSAERPTILWRWWRVTSGLRPIVKSHFGRDVATDAVIWGRNLMAEPFRFDEPAHDVAAEIFDLLNQVESEVSNEVIDTFDERVRELSGDDHRIWGRLLAATSDRVVDEERERLRTRTLARRTGDVLLVGMADLLEGGPGALGSDEGSAGAYFDPDHRPPGEVLSGALSGALDFEPFIEP